MQRQLVIFYNSAHKLIKESHLDSAKSTKVRHILKTIEERAGVTNVHPHRFRRTFATSLANRGMDIQEIGKLLGHANLNTTLTYVYSSDEKVRNSYLKFSA